MSFKPILKISDYDYVLPIEKIAQYPTTMRDESKLLIYQNGQISENRFKNIIDILSENSLIVFNDTKVIQSRFLFQKQSGAKIEIFCLEPLWPSQDFQLTLQAKEKVVWNCLIGNSKKWKKGDLYINQTINHQNIKLRATKLNQNQVEFNWTPSSNNFAEIMFEIGHTPLPPYMKRKAEEEDKNRYQTIYSQFDGSVAAPTAGLHFTKSIMQNLKSNQIETNYVTLHVGAGTFIPVSKDNITDHRMHNEQIIINKTLIEKLISLENKKIIAVGTTSIRTLESMYWFGVMLSENKNAKFNIEQWFPYKNNLVVSVKQALQNILNFLNRNKLEELKGTTTLMIAPGYKYHIVDEMITNFHQPKSTLLLLIAAYLGNEWKRIYDYALQHDFRFLSYGDACYFSK